VKPHQDASQIKLLKIGELAKQADVAVGTIRYYESLGLLEPAQRSKSGYRYYTANAIKRLEFIKKAQLLRFSLSEVQQILGVRDRGEPVCSLVHALLNKKIKELDEQLRQISMFKTELENYRDLWTNRTFDEPQGQQVCSLIEEVANNFSSHDYQN
jgi:DNA-binding transcriptional MerR regulator